MCSNQVAVVVTLVRGPNGSKNAAVTKARWGSRVVLGHQIRAMQANAKPVCIIGVKSPAVVGVLNPSERVRE